MFVADFLGWNGREWTDTLGLIFTFFILMPLLAHGLIGFAVAQVMGERQANQAYARGDEVGPSQG